MRKVVPAALFASICLSACSGGGGDPIATGEYQAGLFGSYSSTATRIANDPTYQRQTSFFSVPTTGSARYRGVGVVSAEIAPEQELVAAGRAIVDVHFGPGTVSGEIDRLVTEDDELVSGSVTVTRSAAVGQQIGSTFSTSGVGTIEAQGETHRLSVNGRGIFFGPRADAMLIDMSGRSTSASYTGTAEVAIIADQ